MTYPIHVMHVPGADPARDAIVARLVDEAGACVHEDPERRDTMWTWVQAANCAADDTAEWSIIVQDDAEPLPGWESHLRQALKYSPSPFLALTHAGRYGKDLYDKGHPYGVGHCTMWGTAIAYHRSVMGPLAEWATRLYQATGYRHDDTAVCGFARKHRFETAAVSRAIFWTNMPSLLGHFNAHSNSPLCTITNSTKYLPYTAPPGRLSAFSSSKEDMEIMATTSRWAELRK